MRNFNKMILACLFFLGTGIVANAQQYVTETKSIKEAYFTVKFNKSNKTCEIFDGKVKVEDCKHPYKNMTRKFYSNRRSGEWVAVNIPSTFQCDGVDYNLVTIGEAAFAKYEADEFIIPPTVKTIKNHAFLHSTCKKISIPASVTDIEGRAFAWCRNLKEIEMPKKFIADEYNYLFINCRKEPEKLAVSDNIIPIDTGHLPPIPIPEPIVKSSDVDENIPRNPKTSSEIFAVIIANENYKNLGKVNYAKHDGDTFKEYCLHTLGLEADHIKHLTDATQNDIRGAVNWLQTAASINEGEARFLVYYAGHGMPDEKTGSAYLMPVDGYGTDVQSGYSLNKLYDELGALSAKNVTVFLDACFSGANRGEGFQTAARNISTASKVNAPKGNLIVFSAAQGDETAWPYEEKGHGMFTYFLLKKLQESKGDVTLDELGKYVTKQVKNKSFLANDKAQTPTVRASVRFGDSWRKMTLRQK